MNTLQKRIMMIGAILITLIAGLLMALYGFNKRYTKDNANIVKDMMTNYYEKNEGNEIEAYLKYKEYKYNKTPIKKETVKDGEGFEIYSYEIYEGLSKGKLLENSNEKEDIYLDYIYFIYNIQYERILKQTGIKDADLENASLLISLKAYNPEAQNDLDYDNNDMIIYSSSPIEVASRNSYLELIDKTSDRYSEVKEENYQDPYYYVGSLQITSFQSSSFKLGFTFKASVKNSEKEYDIKRDVIEMNHPTSYSDSFNLANFLDGNNADIIKLGYKGYVFSKYIWWQTLISMAVIGIISFAFYFALTYDDKNR